MRTDNKYLQIAAEMLGTSPEMFDSYPDFIREKMEWTVESVAEIMQENLHMMHRSLRWLQCYASADEFLRELSDVSGYRIEQLRMINDYSRLYILSNYIDNEKTMGKEEAMQDAIVEAELAIQIIGIDDVAHFLGIKLEVMINEYSHETLCKLCDVYLTAVSYEPVDTEDLARDLTNILGTDGYFL